jgi:hypothetical protein
MLLKFYYGPINYFPETLNLFDSIGEMYQNLKQNDKARGFYLVLDKKIEGQKARCSVS